MKNLKVLCLLLILPAFLSAQSAIETWTKKYDKLLKTYVSDGRIDYVGIKNNSQLGLLVTQLKDLKPTNLNTPFAKAFYINAYNILVIYAAANEYPVGSVQEVSGFFERTKYPVSGKKYTLNSLEKDFIFKKYPDPRLHFVLVCGALGCPPITNFAYQPDQLDSQLEAQTKAAMNDPNFIRYDGNTASISKIFQWYNADFGGGKKDVLNYINQYRTSNIPTSSTIGYYTYDWALNDLKTVGQSAATGGANSFRYVTSATIPKGQIELKFFNNLFTQRIAESEESNELIERNTFNTVDISALYGVTPRFNAGIDILYVRTLNSGIPSDGLDVFGGLDRPNGRQAIAGIGPRIRWAPIPEWSGFSLQSTLSFPIGNNLEGFFDPDDASNNQPFIEWDQPTFWTQFFYDQSIGTQFSFFAEIDFLWEDIGDIDKITTPTTVILSYFPHKKVTFYGLVGYSPQLRSDFDGFDYFHQAGLGTKLQVTRRFEIELLYTRFRTRFVNSRNGNAGTYNLGLRFSL